MGLTNEQIKALMGPTAPPKQTTITTPISKYARVEQFGPLRWYDTSDRCASRGCGSETFCKVNGIPRCMIHALRELNDLLVGQL